MITKVKMPRLGENVNSVFIVEIKCEPGQQISAGEILVSVETDKATIDVESPVDGKVIEFLVKIDDEIEPGTAYVIIETA
jgi:pyruvate/2-oxoglutarate dehydrogenase complex dihydrolipoamide acyltransferase (E2) component